MPATARHPGPRARDALHIDASPAQGPWKPQRHALVDLWQCPAERLSDEEFIREAMVEAADRAGATVIDQAFHRFEGGGITGVVTVKESHLTIHTWPERGYAAVDIFLCGRAKPRVALAYLADRLRARTHTVREHRRGETMPCGRGRAAAARGDTVPRSMTMLYGLTVVVAMCSIIYELLLAQTLSALLGNTVLRYSVTIGVYLGALGLGALLCGPAPERATDRLIRVELSLSVLGAVSVPIFYFLDVVQRFVYLQVAFGSVWETVAPVGFLLCTHALIVAIGLLSGFEVPLLLALGERMRLGSTNRVLGVDYFGALVGSVLFPVLLLRSFGLLATGFAVALANLMAALVLILWARVRRPVRYGLATAAISAGLVVALGHAYGIEQYFLKKFYYGEDVTGLSSLFHTQSTRPPIERHRSAYQTIDLAQDSLDSQWVYDEISAKRTAEPRYPRNLWLYLDREYQVHSGTDEVYHEWFVHAPVQANGHAPHHVLVLGGGDGLAVREALKYPTVTRVVHVDIDPVMLRLAREHPLLSAMNGGVHDDPRVTIVEADAVQWLRTTVARFDAIYIDMPAPRDYSLSQVYSREFYGLVRHHLDTGGFVAIDTPSGWCENPDNLWAIYYSTLRAAGFETVVPMIARINTGAPRVLDAIDRLIAETEVTVPAPGGGTIALNEAQAHEYYDGALDELLSQGADEFVLAFPSRRTVNTTWRTDLAVPRYMFGPPHLPLAFPDGCASEFQLTKVNSIARPTLPELEWLSIRFP